VTSLLARLPSLGPGDGEPRASTTAWLAGAAALAVQVLGLLGLGLALVVVQTLDPDGGLPVGSSARLATQLWLLAQGAQLDLPSGPLRVAPLLLTLLIAWGLNRAAGSVASLRAVDTAAGAAQVLGVVVAVHLLATAALTLLADDPAAPIGLLRPLVGALLLALVAGGLGVLRDSGLSAAVADRFPGPGRALWQAVVAGTLTLAACCTAVVAAAPAPGPPGRWG
jgi:hypothetical protein